MEKTLSLVEHLEELKKRLVASLLVMFFCAIFCFFYSDALLNVFSKPVGKLVFIKPTEAFFVTLKLSLYGGIFLSAPFIIYQIWAFVSPGLLGRERKFFYWIVPASYLLFITGVIFALRGVLPISMKFLLSYGGENIYPLISVSSYISFVTLFLLGFGLVFQLPFVILLLTKLGIVTPEWLSSNRKYAVLIIFVLSTILTPGPDVFSQFMMAIPTLVLYEIGIMLSKLFCQRELRQTTRRTSQVVVAGSEAE